jgi:hypothetical protein
MKIHRIEEMVGGWFIGDFDPAAFKSKQFEVGYKFHPAGEKWDAHYHKEADEITFLLRGRMIIQGQELKSGDVFVINKYEVADPVFLEDCEVVVIKTPSVVGDKYTV